MPPFVKGQSGNPKGRPPKTRALTAVLETALSKTIEIPDYATGEMVKVSRKKLLAELVMQAIERGSVKLPTIPEPTILVVKDFKEWSDFVAFIYKHVDGPPVQNIDLTSDGQSLNPGTLRVILHDQENDNEQKPQKAPLP
jgi:hypothetical protein